MVLTACNAIILIINVSVKRHCTTEEIVNGTLQGSFPGDDILVNNHGRYIISRHEGGSLEEARK